MSGLGTTGSPPVRQAEVDGVPVYWVDTGTRLRAELVFGVGRVDEEFLTTGITHLVEHMTMHRLGDYAHAANACVGVDTTSFEVSRDGNGAPCPAIGFNPAFAPATTIVSATKADSWDDSATPDGKAEPGQTITYDVNVSNTGASSVTTWNVTLNEELGVRIWSFPMRGYSHSPPAWFGEGMIWLASGLSVLTA